MGNHSALIVGATGLVGSYLLNKLCEDPYYYTVYVLTRRPLTHQYEKVKEVIINFDELNEADIPEVDDVFCCLGTTMKKAGSKSAFRKVDYHYPVRIARLAHKKGAKQFFLVSAMGADKESLFFYNRIKGEVEESVAKVGFPAIHILRPSMLLGQREEKRVGEKIGQVVMQGMAPVMIGALKKYRPIEGNAVAQAMLNVAKKDLHGPYIFESDKIKVLAAMN